MALNHRQKLFIFEYLVDFNGTRAAKAAGYTQNTEAAAQQATWLMKKPEVREAIEKAQKEREEKVGFKAEDTLRELARISDADVAECYYPNGDLKPIHEIPVHIRKAIAGIEIEAKYIKVGGKKKRVGTIKKLRFWDKNKALELTGKHQKLFVERIEATGKDGTPLTGQVVVILPPKDEKS